MSKTDGYSFVPYKFDLSGGLNYRGRETVEDNEFVELENFEAINGRLVQRGGITLRSQASAFNTKSVRLIGQLHVPDTNVRSIIASVFNTSGTEDKLYHSSDGGTNWTEILGPGGVGVTVQATRALQYQDTLYIPTMDGIYTWTGSGNMTLPNNTLFSQGGTVVLDRLFVFDDRNVYYSDPGSLTTFPAANVFQILNANRNQYEQILAVVGYKDRVVVFTNNSVYVLFLTGTPTNWSLKILVTDVGATGPFAVDVVDDFIYFIGQHGVYRTNLSTVDELSVNFKDLFYGRASSGEAANPLYGMEDSLAHYNNRILCSINFGGVEAINSAPRHRLFVFNTTDEIWSEWKPNIASSQSNNFKTIFSMLTVENTRGATSDTNAPLGIYIGSGEFDGRTYFYSDANAPQDAGANFDCFARSKNFDFDAPGELKKIPYGNLVALGDANSKIELALVADDTVGSLVTVAAAGSMTGTKYGSHKYRGPGYCRSFGYRIKASTPSGTPSVKTDLAGFSIVSRIPRPVQMKSPQ